MRAGLLQPIVLLLQQHPAMSDALLQFALWNDQRAEDELVGDALYMYHMCRSFIAPFRILVCWCGDDYCCRLRV